MDVEIEHHWAEEPDEGIERIDNRHEDKVGEDQSFREGESIVENKDEQKHRNGGSDTDEGSKKTQRERFVFEEVFFLFVKSKSGEAEVESVDSQAELGTEKVDDQSA